MLEKRGEKLRKHAPVAAVAAALVLLILLLVLAAPGRAGKNAASAEDRLSFIRELGWEVDENSEESRSVKIPDCSEGAMADYNALMLSAGYDLSPLVGKNVEQYSYEITNYPNCSQTVYLTIYVYEGRVVGGDIHTASVSGFMHELRARPEG